MGPHGFQLLDNIVLLAHHVLSVALVAGVDSVASLVINGLRRGTADIVVGGGIVS